MKFKDTQVLFKYILSNALLYKLLKSIGKLYFSQVPNLIASSNIYIVYTPFTTSYHILSFIAYIYTEIPLEFAHFLVTLVAIKLTCSFCNALSSPVICSSWDFKSCTCSDSSDTLMPGTNFSDMVPKLPFGIAACN